MLIFINKLSFSQSDSMDIYDYSFTQLSKLKIISASKAPQIIALTSYAMTGDRQKALDAGCTGYIEKPIDPETIMNEINKFLKNN